MCIGLAVVKGENTAIRRAAWLRCSARVATSNRHSVQSIGCINVARRAREQKLLIFHSRRAFLHIYVIVNQHELASCWKRRLSHVATRAAFTVTLTFRQRRIRKLESPSPSFPLQPLPYSVAAQSDCLFLFALSIGTSQLRDECLLLCNCTADLMADAILLCSFSNALDQDY